MKIMVVTGSPNKDGLTAACGEQARAGATTAGAEVIELNLNEMSIGMCHACNRGWGPCRDMHTCQTTDDFEKFHALMKEMDGFIIVTPVYWGDMSESMKAFCDRVRRCEALKKEDQYIMGKPFICIAAAGGTGNGCISCLTTMERFLDHVKALKYDFINITRRNRKYKLKTIYQAARSMAESLQSDK